MAAGFDDDMAASFLELNLPLLQCYTFLLVGRRVAKISEQPLVVPLRNDTLFAFRYSDHVAMKVCRLIRQNRHPRTAALATFTEP